MFIQSIPEYVRPGVCRLCKFTRTCCADVVFKASKRAVLVCSQCRIDTEGEWTVGVGLRPEPDLPEDESRARRLGRGLKARSPSKHTMPFTF